MKTPIEISRYPSPVGQLSLATFEGRLVHLDFEGNDQRLYTIQTRRFRTPQWQERADAAPLAVCDWLQAYFEGTVLPLPWQDIHLVGTPFQQKVWQALITIPAGEHRSYKALAASLGNSNAVRAVARANALNPVSILIPCHRVIGSNGKLTGYAGGLERKAWLLEFEAGKHHRIP